MLPNKLKTGDTIFVVAPSKSFTDKYVDNFNKAVEFFESRGFIVKFNEKIFSEQTPLEKANDINNAFSSNEVKAIICLQGGNTANRVLTYLDYENIKKNPKIIIGLSDITVLLNAIYAKAGLVTYHGNDWLHGFGGKMTDYDINDFEETFVLGNRSEIKPVNKRIIVRNGAGEGKLIGGNLRCLLKLAGTPYFPDFTDAILFVETLNGKPEDCEYMFEQLKQIGVMDKIKGVIVGYIKGMQENNPNDRQMEDILFEVSSEYTFPIIKCDDFGHKNSNATMPIGIKVGIDTGDNSIKLLDKGILTI